MLHLIFWKIQENFEFTPKWILDFCKINLWTMSSFFWGRNFMKHFLFKAIAGLKLLTHRGVPWKEPMGCLRINLQEDKMIPKSSEIGNFELLWNLFVN
jgi:hypothetical protein